MRTYGWLIAASSLLATTYAWPQLPHFELQETGVVDVTTTQQSLKGTCKRIEALTRLSNMAANQTRLNELLAEERLTQAQVDDIDNKKDAVNAELQALIANATVATECGSIHAHHQAVKDCKKLDKLEKLTNLANNKTAYDEHLAGELLNKKQTEQLKKNMETAEIKLQEMRGNTTLVVLCAKEVGLRQNGASHELGDIGQVAVDNSGAISMSTSGAPLLKPDTWLASRLLGCAWLLMIVLI